MANIKSQLKRIKTNEKARLRNKSVKSSLKTAIRKFREAADAGDVATATELMKTASKQLDKAASKGVIHKNQAADAGDVDTATQLMRDANKALDKAASKGVIHANQAANRKSAIAKRTAALSGSPKA